MCKKSNTEAMRLLALARNCFYQSSIARTEEGAEVLNRMGRDYLARAKRIDPTIELRISHFVLGMGPKRCHGCAECRRSPSTVASFDAYQGRACSTARYSCRSRTRAAEPAVSRTLHFERKRPAMSVMTAARATFLPSGDQIPVLGQGTWRMAEGRRLRYPAGEQARPCSREPGCTRHPSHVAGPRRPRPRLSAAHKQPLAMD